MAELAQFQAWMQSAVLHPGTASTDEIRARIRGNPRLTPEASLAIYQRSYGLRLAACMRSLFPASCYALGEALFNDFVAEYVHQTPPESYTLHDLGRRFTAFLEANRPDRDAPEVWVDFLIDLSRYEREMAATFDGPGAEHLPIATEETPDAALRAQPSLSVAAYGFNVARYYHSVRAGHAPPPPDPSVTYVALARHQFVTNTLVLSQPQYCVLSAMCTGATLADAMARAAAELGQDVETLLTAWRDHQTRLRWIEAGLFLDAERSDAQP